MKVPATATPAPDERLPMPTSCSRISPEGDGCLPAEEWAERACQGVYPGVALYMLRGGTPWQRLYLLERAPGTNASGGVSLLDTPLQPGEEVIALRRHGSAGGIQVSDTSGYDVLRWDGSCVTLHDGEFSAKPPRKAGFTRVDWPKLDDDLQRSLRKSESVNSAFRARRDECKGAYFGPVTDKCVVLDKQLTQAIVQQVREGVDLPVPQSRP